MSVSLNLSIPTTGSTLSQLQFILTWPLHYTLPLNFKRRINLINKVKPKYFSSLWPLLHKIHHLAALACHIITTVHNLWKEEGGLFGCYHCLVMLLPAGKGGNLVFLAFVRLYFSAAQTSISLFCSIVFVCTSSASFHRELWDFKSVEHCGIAPRPLCHKQLHVFNLFAPKQKIFTFFKGKDKFLRCSPQSLLKKYDNPLKSGAISHKTSRLERKIKEEILPNPNMRSVIFGKNEDYFQNPSWMFFQPFCSKSK